jgi:hypothetical protein
LARDERQLSMAPKLGLTAAAALLAALAAATALAAPGPPPKLNKRQLAPKTCGAGRLVIDVDQKIVNDVDSGTQGNFWAFDNYHRSIKVWRLGTNNFCTIVRYAGSFRTIAGTSPGASGTVSAGITGHFDGGYRMDFNGTPIAHPTVKTHGSIGTFDYRCNTAGNCPGSVYWVTLFFTNVTGDDFDWWGWLYKAGKNGTWLNSIDGARGDITGTAAHGKGKAKGKTH